VVNIVAIANADRCHGVSIASTPFMLSTSTPFRHGILNGDRPLNPTNRDRHLIPFFFIGVTTNAGLASIRAWMSVMDLEIWYHPTNHRSPPQSINQ
jgi:hypothetical protein